MSDTAAAHAAHGHHATPSFISHYIFSTDHKMIGRQFLFMGLLMLMVGGMLAMLSPPGRKPRCRGSTSFGPYVTPDLTAAVLFRRRPQCALHHGVRSVFSSSCRLW
jgi:hypothetical protein